MSIAAVRYLTLAFKHPLARQSGILRGGFGIESRAQAYSRMWQPHLERSKKFVLRTLGPASGSDSLLILGAGRLYDVPLEQLAELYKKIYLVDADPSCLHFHQFKPTRCEVTSTIMDLTGSLGRFIEILRTAKFKNWEDALQFLETVDLVPEELKLPQGCDVVSMNILSQLALPFRDLFETRLKKQFGKAAVEKEETAWLTAFLPFGRRIIRGHFDLMKEVRAKQIVIVTDTEHAYYKSSQRFQESPITPQAAAFEWKAINKAVEPLEVSSALSDIEIGSEIETSLPDHRRSASELWSWHLTPALGSTPGQVNRVEGFFLRR